MLRRMQGGIFSDRVKDGRAAAQIAVTPTRVEATTADGSVFSIDAEQCVVELGGASGRMWFLRNPDRTLTIFSEAPAMGRALHAAPALAARVQSLRQARSRARRHGAWIWLGLAALLALGCWGAHAGLLALTRAAVGALPTSADEQLGKIAVEHMDLGGDRVKAPPVIDGVTAIVERLAPHADAGELSFHVQVVASDEVNAFALPGGEIVVYTGLLRAAESPEQVAGVIAHEMAHVTLRHGMTRIAHAVGLTAAADLLLGDVAGLSGLVLELARSGALTQYDRAQERAADARGARTLAAAGIDPRAMASFFALMAKREQPAEGDETALQMPAWLGTHPAPEAREHTIAALARELGPVDVRPLSIDWQALRAALPGPSDATPDLNPVAEPGDDGPAVMPEPDAN